MSKNHLLVLLLLFAPSLAFADKGKKSNSWWTIPLIMVYVGFFLFAAGLALCYRHFSERGHRVDYHNGVGMAAERGLDAAEIESLPSLRFSEMKLHRLGVGEPGDEQVECAVCLAEFKDQEVISILPDCFHVFHPYCIAPWLASHVTCPTCRSSLEHRQGSSLSRSTIFDGISGPLSQRFDHSGDQNHNDDHDDDHHHHVTVDIERSSPLQSEVNLDGSAQLDLAGRMGKLHRSYSTGDLMIHMVGKNSATKSTSLSSSLPQESSTKSDYRTTAAKNVDNWMSNISRNKSDRFVDYSSLIFVEMKSTSMSARNEASTLEVEP